MLLSSDWHLDEDPDNEYRWLIWEDVRAQIRGGQKLVYMLGDLGDKKDRHGGEFANRVIDEIDKTCELGVELHGEDFAFVFIPGNHDRSIKGRAYWRMINKLSHACAIFLEEPTRSGDQWFLPWSADPATDWADLDYDGIKVVFMHQTLHGARAEGAGHREMEGLPGIPKFPADVLVYSGDIHLPQVVPWGADVVYVGAPHTVRFGDEHDCRMLVLDESTYEVTDIVFRNHVPIKMVAKCGSLAELEALETQPGDKLKIKFTVPADRIEQWAVDEAEIRRWAAGRGIELAAIEPAIDQHVADDEDRPIDVFNYDPVSILLEYAQAEGLDDGLLLAGQDLLKEEPL